MDRLSTKGEILSQVELDKYPHSSFDMRNHNFMSGKLGKLIPSRFDELYPGDRINGDVQIVANFEPLAAPIMGSMVTKQESFYISYLECWRNAHKFFTGKKGFSTPIPSISPRQLYSNYSDLQVHINGSLRHFVLLVNFNTYLMYASDIKVALDESDEVSFRGTIESVVGSLETHISSLKFIGDQYYVLDLLQPVIDKSESIYSLFNGDLNLDEITVNNLISSIVDLVTYEYKYYFGVSSLLDYLGWPVNDNWDSFFSNKKELILKGEYTSTEPSYLFSAIPLNFLVFRAYYLCWYWNYRDQILEADAYDPEEDDFLADTVSPLQSVLLTLLRVRCWYKDTYTTALNNTGKVQFKVPVDGAPLDDNNPLQWQFFSTNNGDSNLTLINAKDAVEAYEAGATICKAIVGGVEYQVPINYLSGHFNAGQAWQTISTSTSGTGLSLDLFDRFKRLQSFTQKELILGYEAEDVIYAHWHVKLSNVRSRIPELLSRGRDEVQINTIINNTNIPDGQIAGDKTATAWSQGKTSDISYFVEEWGYFMHIYTILPIQSYTGGLSRHFLKLNRFDFAWPEFSTLGMDAVYNAELSAPRGNNNDAVVNGLNDELALMVFGYQGRYYDLKSRKDEEHGRLRTDLNYLTFSREWNERNPPKLNYIFVHCWPRLDMFVTDDPNEDIIRQIDVFHNINMNRILPVPSEYLS